MKKAKIVADSFKNSVNSYIIGADTVVVIEGRILGKPADASDAYEMLKSLSGNWHDVYTGIAVVKINSGIVTSRSEYEKTRVKIADITDEEIYNYINTGEPMDKAGAYGIQGIGALIVEKIEGCYFNVMGLPIYKLSRLLSTMGIELSLIVNKRGRNEGTVKA
jgi:septum formation protein